MKTAILTAALAAAAWLPAQAELVTSAAAVGGGTLVDFEAYDGFFTTGPEVLAPGITFTGDAGSELGAFSRDLGDNGAWGVGNHFAATAFVGELRFSFDTLAQSAGAFVNHVALFDLPFAVVVSAYGDNNQIIETYTLSVDTAFDSYNEGQFVGIARAAADIRAISFKGNAVVLDNLAVAVPEPGTYGLMLAGLALVGFMAVRRRG